MNDRELIQKETDIENTIESILRFIEETLLTFREHIHLLNATEMDKLKKFSANVTEIMASIKKQIEKFPKENPQTEAIIVRHLNLNVKLYAVKNALDAVIAEEKAGQKDLGKQFSTIISKIEEIIKDLEILKRMLSAWKYES